MATAALAAIVGLAVAFRFAAFADVPANPFYDAAVRSMAQSWHNFLYGAFEPGGQVSIDKPPVDLWLQVASVKLLGFSSTTLRLPEAIAGTLAVPLLYDLVRRLFGRPSGLIAAAALAVLPISVLTARSDTMDSVMMLLDVAAAWLVVRGTQMRRVWPIVAAGAVLGLAFEVKLFEGLVALPAIGLLALLGSSLSWRRRVAALAGAAAAFVGVSLAWVALAARAPLASRPWPIGSTNGSPWNVVFVFNGLDRLTAAATPRAMRIDPPSLLRLFSGGSLDYASLIGTELLAAAAFGIPALVILARRSGRNPARTAGLLFLGAWLVLGTVVVSAMLRLHPRYLEALTPAVAAVLGVGAGTLASRTAHGSRPAAEALAVGAAVAAAGGVALAHPPAWASVLAIAFAAGAALLGLALSSRRAAGIAALCAVAAALSVPTATAVSMVATHRSDAGPGPTLAPARVDALSRFLRARQGRAPYEVASTTAATTSPLIIRDGRPILMLTSLYGRPLLTPDRLARLVALHRVRYVLPAWGGCDSRSHGACPPVVRWARAHSVDVSRVSGVGPPSTLAQFTTAGRR